MTVLAIVTQLLSPFIRSQLFGFSSAEYGLWNTMTIIGFVTGFLIVAKIVNKYSSKSILIIALVTMMNLLILLAVLQLVGAVTPFRFFVLMTLMYFVSNFIYSTASHLASNVIECRASASNAMNFVNMLTGIVGCLYNGLFTVRIYLELYCIMYSFTSNMLSIDS